MNAPPPDLVRTVAIVAVIFGLVAVVVFAKWLSLRWYEKMINASVRGFGAQPIKVNWLADYSASDTNDTFYNVTMQLKSGQVKEAICKCNMFHGVYWKDAPWLTALNENPVTGPRSTATFCAQCGSGISSGWSFCPSCGMKHPPPDGAGIVDSKRA